VPDRLKAVFNFI